MLLPGIDGMVEASYVWMHLRQHILVCESVHDILQTEQLY